MFRLNLNYNPCKIKFSSSSSSSLSLHCSTVLSLSQSLSVCLSVSPLRTCFDPLVKLTLACDRFCALPDPTREDGRTRGLNQHMRITDKRRSGNVANETIDVGIRVDSKSNLDFDAKIACPKWSGYILYQVHRSIVILLGLPCPDVFCFQEYILSFFLFFFLHFVFD